MIIFRTRKAKRTKTRKKHCPSFTTTSFDNSMQVKI